MSDHFKRFGKKDLMFPQTQPPLSISLPPPLCLSPAYTYTHALKAGPDLLSTRILLDRQR